jgi:CO dehydrogenase nickel-insertion accessory protein CooC1
MKIVVCGKGGNGKSTIVALLPNEALNKGYQVLVIEYATRSAS